jgi:F-type H+-transporting ATPase subunit delta
VTDYAGASRSATAASTEALDRVIDTGGADLAAVGDELFSVASLLRREMVLRRMLTDASRPAEQRAGLADDLLADRVSAPTRAVVAALVSQRWSRSRDLVDTCEDLAVRSVVASAQAAGSLDDLEDETFRFRRIVAGDPRLRTALSARDVPAAAKQELLDALLGDRVGPATRRLIGRAVERADRESIDDALERYGRIAAARRQRLVASVRSSVELTEEQRDRLGAALHRLYGHGVVINVEIDPTVLGGLAIQIGDEVIDGTVLARLEDARRRLTH